MGQVRFTERRQWLEYNGYASELDNLASEVHAVELTIHRVMKGDDDYFVQGLCSILASISTRLEHMANGQLHNDNAYYDQNDTEDCFEFKEAA